MGYQTTKLNESVERTVMLDNEVVTVKRFNEALDNLKPNERIIESKPNQFFIVERFYD